MYSYQLDRSVSLGLTALTLVTRNLGERLWTFKHRLASWICVGLNKDCSQEYIIKTLMDVGTDVVGATLTKYENRNNANKR